MENITLKQFRKNADKYGVCGISKDWDDCRNNKQIIDLCLSAKGMDYVCGAIANGWGISPNMIEAKFRPFINGSYLCDVRGYESELYCNYKGCASIRSTAIMVVDSDIKLVVSKKMTHLVLYIVGICNIEIIGKNYTNAIIYGDPTSVSVKSKEAILTIEKKEKSDE